MLIYLHITVVAQILKKRDRNEVKNKRKERIDTVFGFQLLLKTKNLNRTALINARLDAYSFYSMPETIIIT